MSEYKYFNEKDFELASPSCSINDMDVLFMRKLDEIRDFCGFPFVINSAYRTKEYEKKMGRNGSSSHTKGVAVDIRAIKDSEKFKIVENAIKCGITRIGIGSNFVHLDYDEDKNKGVIWTY